MLKKRIPTILGLLLLLLGAIGGVLFVDKETDFLPRASPEHTPQKVKLTNLSDTGLVVSWITEEPAIGFVKLGTSAGKLDQTIVDERDQLSGSSGEYRTHYITITGLTPGTEYFFKIGSQRRQLYDNAGQPFSVTTAPAIGTPPPADTAYGTVETPAKTPADGAIVYLSLGGATPLSALVKENGSWAINLSSARAVNGSAFVEYDNEDAIIELLAQSGEVQPGLAKTTTANDQPVPPIIIGQTLDFTTATNPGQTETATEAAEITPEVDNKFSLTPIVATESPGDLDISIDTPQTDGVVVSEAQPEISGQAPPGAALTITVHSNQVYTDTVAVDPDGNWTWTPPGDLEPGEHTVTVSYTDSNGLLKTLTRHFIVSAADNSGWPQYEATPSGATPSPSPRATATPRATASPRPTAAAEPISTPLPEATIRPTASPRPTARPTPEGTPSAELIDAGFTGPTLFIILAGMLMVSGGIFVSRKSHRR